MPIWYLLPFVWWMSSVIKDEYPRLHTFSKGASIDAV